MPHNEHIRPQGCLNIIALVLASITFSMGLWIMFSLATGLIEPYTYQHPCGTDIGTDAYEQCMSNGEEIDLTPIEDEIDTAISTERERA